MQDYQDVDILLVEDNDGDILLAREAFGDAKVGCRITAVRDGIEAMDYLRQRGAYAQAARPDLVLLDLNLPRRNGRQVLADIKSDPSLKTIPVLVLTSSMASEDIEKAYDLQANCYIVKPVGFEKLLQVVRAIESFWLKVVRLPAAAT